MNAISVASRTYTGVERAAVLMMIVGEEEAAAILQKLDPEEVRQLGKAMFAVADVSEDEVERRARPFRQPRPRAHRDRLRPAPADRGGDDARAGRRKRPKACSHGSRLPRRHANSNCSTGSMQARSPQMVEKEHPQIAAVMIANLDPSIGGQVLELLPEAVQPDILHRIARLGPITPEAVETLKSVLANRTAGATSNGVTLGGTREAAKILSGARKATEQRVMPKLFKIDKDVAKAIEEALFVFDHLLEMDDKNLGMLIRNVDGEILTKALKGVDEGVRERFLGCMSARAADGIRDEMEARGPMKLAEVLEAQKAMIQIARGLAKDGTIMMGGGEDDYV